MLPRFNLDLALECHVLRSMVIVGMSGRGANETGLISFYPFNWLNAVRSIHLSLKLSAIMKRFFALSLLSSVLILPALANAADTPVWKKDGGGNINFTGTIKNDGCVVQGPGSSDINIPLGNVQASSLGLVSAPGPVSSAGEVKVTIKCKSAGTKVQMTFAPLPYQLEGTNVLKVDNGSGAAKNVGVALLDAAGTALNLSTGSYSGAMAGGTATLQVRATYVRTVADVDSVVPGIANASMPFVLEYQ